MENSKWNDPVQLRQHLKESHSTVQIRHVGKSMDFGRRQSGALPSSAKFFQANSEFDEFTPHELIRK